MGKKSWDVPNFVVETFSGECMGIGSHFKAAAINIPINFTILIQVFLFLCFVGDHLKTRETVSLHIILVAGTNCGRLK